MKNEKNELVIDITMHEIRKIIKEFVKDLSFISIPGNCYMDTPETPNSEKYKVFYNGKELNDVWGMIRFSPQFTDNNKEKRIITNWKKEFEDE